MARSYPSFEDVQKVRQNLKEISYEHWLYDDFLTWKQWLLLLLSIGPWLIWWKLSDKKRLTEILLYGTLITILCIILDNIGTDLIWWEYPDKLFQMIPPLIPADITLVPCLMMLLYQWTSCWKSYLLFNIILSLAMAYMGETLFIWLNLYKLREWNLFYSVLFYNIAGIITRWIVIKTKKLK